MKLFVNVKNWLKKRPFYFLLLLFCSLLPFVFDLNPAFYGSLASFCLLVFLRKVSFWTFAVYFVFVLVTSVLFLPQIIVFGHPPQTMIAAFFETDLRESKEFVKSLPFYSYFFSVLWFAFGGWVLYLAKKLLQISTKIRIISALFFLILGVVLTIERPLRFYFRGEGFDMSQSKTAIISFYASIHRKIKDYQMYKADIEASMKKESSWEITNVSPKYQDYVLVIGESVLRDYMQVYGFPLKNTPFAQRANGIILEGFTAAAPNTISALTRALMQRENNELVYQNNIISLAKKAGFQTIWISNQGFAGGHDSAVSKIASLSDEKVFTKTYDSTSLNYNDIELIPIFKRLFKEKSEKPRLFVLHLMGSHSTFSERLRNSIHYNYINRSMSAYVQTLEETDELLSEVYQILKDNSQSFSMLYFADHGLMSQDRNNSLFATLTHGSTAPKKSVYRVPFMMFSSDDTENKYIKVEKSAYNFIFGFSNWLGIEEKTLKKYNFFSSEADTLKVFNHFEDVFYHDLEEEEVIKE